MKKNSKQLQITKKLHEMSKGELIKIVEATALAEVSPEKYKEKIKSLMPEFVREMDNKEDMGTAIFHANQEMLLVLFDCLRRYHGWDDVQMKQLKRELNDVLTGLKEYEEGGLSFLSVHDVTILGDKIQAEGIPGLMAGIAEAKLKKIKLTKLGMEVPIQAGAEAMSKRLQKPQ